MYVLSNLSKEIFTNSQYLKSGSDQFVAYQSVIFPSLRDCCRCLLTVFCKSWSKEPPPQGGFSYLLCSLIKNPEEEDPPWRTTPKIDQFWGWFFRGGPLPSDSWLGNIINRKPPPGGGRFFRSKCIPWHKTQKNSKKPENLPVPTQGVTVPGIPFRAVPVKKKVVNTRNSI